MKNMYKLTNKRNALIQIADKVARQNLFRQHNDDGLESLPDESAWDDHYVMSSHRNSKQQIFQLISNNANKAAVKVCVSLYLFLARLMCEY